jgi:hypothetical protein
MKKIPTSTHGVLDYLVSGTLVIAPHLVGFPRRGPARIIPRLLGGFSAKYSAVTDYELGLLKKLPMRAHLVLDVASGLLLAASPWLMGFRNRRRSSWVPHVLVGAMEVAVAAMSESRTATRRAGDRIRRATSDAPREVRSRVRSVA